MEPEFWNFSVPVESSWTLEFLFQNLLIIWASFFFYFKSKRSTCLNNISSIIEKSFLCIYKKLIKKFLFCKYCLHPFDIDVKVLWSIKIKYITTSNISIFPNRILIYTKYYYQLNTNTITLPPSNNHHITSSQRSISTIKLIRRSKVPNDRSPIFTKTQDESESSWQILAHQRLTPS